MISLQQKQQEIRDKFYILFIEKNLWQGEDAETKNVAVGNLLDFLNTITEEVWEAAEKEFRHQLLSTGCLHVYHQRHCPHDGCPNYRNL